MTKRKSTKPNQADVVLRHLNTAGSITQVEAAAIYKIRSVSSRASEIDRMLEGTTKRLHRTPKTDMTGQRYVRYSLVNRAGVGL